jgi:hypothetical protein
VKAKLIAIDQQNLHGAYMTQIMRRTQTNKTVETFGITGVPGGTRTLAKLLI